MTDMLPWIFWLSLAVVVGTYGVYPLVLGVCSRLWSNPWHTSRGPWPEVSVILAARNEQSRIAARVQEIVEHLQASQIPGQVIVVSDGSTDDTVGRVAQLAIPNVTVCHLANHVGKAEALNHGFRRATGEILILTDVRQTWEPGAAERLLENFADARVGAVSGDLVLEESNGTLEGVGLYWRLEKWMRGRESRLHSCVGVSGALCAVRRQLFCEIPRGTLLDDVYWPLRVAMQGFRVVHDARARFRDRLPPRSRDEFRRKVRTLSGNFQLLTRLPTALLPWRNPLWIPFLFHKLARLACPWALLTLAVVSITLHGPWYRGVVLVQSACYGLAILGCVRTIAERNRLASAAASFVLLNTAWFLAFWVWLLGKSGGTWRTVGYDRQSTSGSRS